MKKFTISQLALDVATLLGESLTLECQPEESPFPRIEDRVRILVPGLIHKLMIRSPDSLDLSGEIELPHFLYHKLLLKLAEGINPSLSLP